jgi:serine/threonine protein phosphatase PrpC
MQRKSTEMSWRDLWRKKGTHLKVMHTAGENEASLNRKNEPSPAQCDNPLQCDDTSPPRMASEGSRTIIGDESTDALLRPIVIGKESPQLFEPKYVDAVKYLAPPFIPDTIVDGWENDFLTLRGASVRGGSHRWENTPRQDSFATAFIPDKDWVVIAVADGVSGAPQSHIGASVAVNSVIDYFIHTKTTELEHTDWKHVCETIAWNLSLKAKAMQGHGNMPDVTGETESDLATAALKYLATTLVCAVITKAQGKDGLAAHIITVGDSGVWLLSNAIFQAVAGGKDDISEITANDVVPLPYVPDTVEPIKIPVRPGEVLLLGTDGFGEPLGSGDGDLGLFFKATLETIPSAIHFVNALDFTRRYFVDDRTLVAIWPKEGARDK